MDIDRNRIELIKILKAFGTNQGDNLIIINTEQFDDFKNVFEFSPSFRENLSSKDINIMQIIDSYLHFHDEISIIITSDLEIKINLLDIINEIPDKNIEFFKKTGNFNNIDEYIDAFLNQYRQEIYNNVHNILKNGKMN